MKTRTSFVSNSSSSSFIVAIKRDANRPCPTCGRKPANIILLIEEIDDYSGDNSINNIEDAISEYEEFIKENQDKISDLEKGLKVQYYEAKDIPTLKEENAKTKSMIASIKKYADDKDYNVYDISFSSHNETLREIYDQEKANGSIIEIIGESE